MINLNILKNKPILIDEHGEEFLDLQFQTLPTNFYDTEYAFTITLVTKDVEFKPIFLTILSYNSPKYWDLYLKINEISNPFDIQAGDILITPELRFFNDLILLENESSNTAILNEVIKDKNRERAGKVDKRRATSLTPVKQSTPRNSLVEQNGTIIVNTQLNTNGIESINSLKKEILKKALEHAKNSGNNLLACQLEKKINCGEV